MKPTLLLRITGKLLSTSAHHISACSFERVVRTAKARYVVGFSATVERKDGHHPIIFMQCGPVRHRVTVKMQQASDQMAISSSPKDQFCVAGCVNRTKEPDHPWCL
jgi:hypothetical protein